MTSDVTGFTTVFNFIHSKLFQPQTGLEDIQDWRQYVLSILLFAVTVLGSIVAVPSILFAFRERLWSVVAIDTGALIWVVTVWYLDSLSFRMRSWNLCGLLYLLGLSFIFTVGPAAQIYLMAFPAMVALFLGLRPALYALVLNAVTLLGVGYLANTDLHIAALENEPLLKWVVLTINFMFVNTMITLSIVMLLRGIEHSLGRMRESEERFRKLTAISSDFYWESDARHLLTRSTESATKSRESMLDQESTAEKRTREMPSLSFATAAWNEHQTLLDAHLPFRNLEISRPGADGTVLHIAVSGDPMFDPVGGFLGYRGVGTDITERKQLEKGMAESEQRMELALAGADLGLWDLDVASGKLTYNPRLLAMVGLAPGEMAVNALNFVSLLHPDDAPTFFAAFYAHLKSETPNLEIEYRIRHKAGYWIWLLSRGKVMGRDERGRAVRMTGTNLDITERKTIQLHLEDQKAYLEDLVAKRTTELTSALKAAKEADQAKDAFLANMSHELRTPLNGVIGMARMARDISIEPKQQDYLDKVIGSGKHLNRIINDLLDLSKIAAGHMEFETIPFSIGGVLQRCNSIMAHRAAEKGLVLVDKIDAAVPNVLLGDPTRIEQIVLNLVGNAIKFTPEGRVEVRMNTYGRDQDHVRLRIEIEDTGVGIPPGDLEKLFRPFSQADVTVSRKFGGTGLGLALSRHLAEMMDGDINVVSQEGVGTKFTVSIRLGVGDTTDLQPIELLDSEPLPTWYQDTHILVAEDQPLNREIVEALLTKVGISPVMVEDGQQVLDILDRSGAKSFDLVLMDVQMPVMDGLSATRALRRRKGFEVLPVVAMTAHTMAHEKEIALAAGTNDHIGKPFDNDVFYRTLAQWIPKSKQQTTRPLGPSYVQVAEGNSLKSLLGLDVEAGLARFGGNEDRYRHWLADFVTTAAKIPDEIRKEIADNGTEAARKLAHAFKGKVGMLGMTELHGDVVAVEVALRDSVSFDNPLVKLDLSIGQMRGELARVLVATNQSR